MNNEIYKLAFKQFMTFCLWMFAARISKGFAFPVMTLVGVVWAFNGKFAKAFSIYAMLLMMVVLNPNILPKIGLMYSLGLRFGPLIIGLALAMRAITITSRRALPLGVMILYLLAAAVSSIDGWYPPVSYMKLINFTVFFFGIWLGSKGLQFDIKDLKVLRATYLALAVFIIAGSAAIWPFPGISTMNSLMMMNEVGDAAVRNEIILEIIDSGGMALFCGVAFHSQTLAPLLACAFAWVLCDLLFVERSIRWPHVVLLILSLPLLYLTRSRVALLCVVMTLTMVYFDLSHKMNLDRRTKRWIGHVLIVGSVALFVVVVVAEINSNAISRWVRKTDDVQSDQRTLSEAFTASRQGLMDMCMDDFRRNPLFGMGFQVAEYTKTFAQGKEGLILSSPIEKGVIPVMVLGETGIVGATVFMLVLMTFYVGCIKKRLYITLAMMTLFLTINMGEATFFSPGGAGGTEWMFCVVGGYVLDLMIAAEFRRRMEWKV